MILGLRTAIYAAPDLGASKAFYTAVTGVPPYFDEPYYVGFNVGGFELGLVPDAVPGGEGVAALWGTADIEGELARLLALGARAKQAVTDVGGGIRVASVLDPAGNVFTIIENPHFDPARVR